MANLKIKIFFYSLALIMLFQAQVFSILPPSALAQIAPITTAAPKDPCQAYKDQFKVGTGNIIGDTPVYCSATSIIVTVTKYLLMMSGTIAVLFIIIGGFWYLTSAGNEEQAEKGQKTLTNAVIGLVVIILSTTIVVIVANTLSIAK